MMAEPRGAIIRVALYGAASLVLYSALTAVVPGLVSAEPTFAGEIFSRVPVLQGDALGEDHIAASTPFAGIVLALFVLYALALRDLSRSASSILTTVVFVAGTLCLLVQLMGPVMYSQDPYAYATYGRETAVYGGSPYTPEPKIAEDDPFLNLWPSGYVHSRYGPVWTFVSHVIATVAGDRVGLTVLLYRAVAIAAALLAALCIYRCLLLLAPARAAAGAAFFLWNPLVVLESGANAHNDVLLAALLMAAFWSLLRSRFALSIALLTLSALVKVIAVAAVPLFLAYALRQIPEWRSRASMLARSAVFPAAAVFALTVGYPGSMSSVLEAGTSSSSYTNSLHELAFEQLRIAFGDPPEMSRVPVHFEGWWLKSTKETSLRRRDEGAGEDVGTVGAGVALLVLAPQMTEWAFVVDSATRKTGYVNTADTEEIERPASVDNDPVLSRMARGPSASLVIERTNRSIRIFSYAGFCIVWLIATWRCTTTRRLAVGVTAVFLATYWLLLGWFWPWYLIWALAPAALAWDGKSAWLTALLSATVLSLYVSTGASEAAYHYRALPMFVLPIVLYPLRWLRRRSGA